MRHFPFSTNKTQVNSGVIAFLPPLPKDTHNLQVYIIFLTQSQKQNLSSCICWMFMLEQASKKPTCKTPQLLGGPVAYFSHAPSCRLFTLMSMPISHISTVLHREHFFVCLQPTEVKHFSKSGGKT